jgi:type I restriction enzyme M protein
MVKSDNMDVIAKGPEWVEKRYDLLWNEFKDDGFSLEQAANLLNDKIGDKPEQITVYISEMKRLGWLKIGLDPKDSRKRVYNLIDKTNIFEGITTDKNKKLGREDIERVLKRAADLIRTSVDYKFILILLFLKRVNDKWELEYENAYKEALKDGLGEKDAKKEAANQAYHDFDLPDEAKWDIIRGSVSDLPEKFSKAMKALSERNPELRDLFDNVDYHQFASNRENADTLRQLVELFSEQRLHNVSPDVLGDAYEWILRYFLPQKAKEGEVYTPREVIKLLIEVLDPKPKESVYDPACGSGGMLITSYKHVQEKEGNSDANKLFLYGQEINPQSLILGRMNMYIHDISNVQLVQGNTLSNPKFKEGNYIKQFDVVVANPPWNLDGYDEERIKSGEFWQKRFEFGFTPSQSADWAWIQHMLASADGSTGRVGVVMDNGCLFRGGKEGAIRKQILEKDKIECVILLPEKLFYNTGAPSAILFLRNNKPKERRNKILFINATNKFKKHTEVRKLNQLDVSSIGAIVEAFTKFKDIEKFAKVISLEEIIKNNYDLNVSRYADISEEEKQVNIPTVWNEIVVLEKEKKEIDAKIENYLKEIGYHG